MLNDFSLRSQFAHQFGTFHLVEVDGGRHGTIFGKVGRIEVPTCIDGGVEYQFRLCVGNLFQLGLELDRFLHLRQQGQHADERKQVRQNNRFLHLLCYVI